MGFNEEGVYDASDYRTIYTLVGNTKQRGVGDLFKRGLMAAFMLRILELTPFFFNGGSDPRNVKLQVGTSLIQSDQTSIYDFESSECLKICWLAKITNSKIHFDEQSLSCLVSNHLESHCGNMMLEAGAWALS